MIDNPNLTQNTFQRPSHVLLAEMKDLHDAFAKLSNDFSILCDRMETCARRLSACNSDLSRSLFDEYDRAGFAIGKFVRFTDAENPGTLYLIAGIDSGGFWLRRLPDGEEHHLGLLDNRPRLAKAVTYNRSSKRVREAMGEEPPGPGASA